MLIEFSVKNFRSFKEKTTLSLEQINEYNEEADNNELSKTTAIYGANAAGKTNLVKAFSSAILIVRQSDFRQIGDVLPEVSPFVFDDECKIKPSEFEFIFISNNEKYKYGFSATKEKIYNEFLYKYNNVNSIDDDNLIMIFERNNVNEYKFIEEDEELLNELKTKNTEKKLFLATATNWNYEKTKLPYLWFNKIDTYIGGEFLNNFLNIEKLSQSDNELKNFTLDLLKLADIVIDDYNVEIKEPQDVVSSDKGITIKIPSFQIEMLHHAKDKNGNVKQIKMGIGDESAGTVNIFAMSPVLKEAFENGRVIIVDEIERSLHPLLVEMIVRLFNNPEVNIGNAQLIFCTHDTNLLSLDILKRDQIWFVEKNLEKGTTDLYSLVDFPAQENENIQGKYLNGRYGAIPFVVTGNKLWQENKEEDTKNQ